MTCLGCGEPLTGRQSTWCSDRCRDATRRPSLYELPIRAPRGSRAVYANPGNRGTQRTDEGACEVCGTDLPADSRRSRRFCSEACKKQAKRRRVDIRVGTDRARERRLEHLEAKNERDTRRALHGDLQAAGLEPGSDPDFGLRLDRRQGSEEAVRAAQALEAGLRPTSLKPSQKDSRPLWKQSLDALKHGVEIDGRVLRIRDGREQAAVLEVVNEPTRQRALDYVDWRRAVHETGVLEGELGPEHRPALPLRIVPVYTTADETRTTTDEVNEVTNAELLERIDAIEATVREMLLQAAEAATRLAERHPDRRGAILRTVEALLEDIALRGR